MVQKSHWKVIKRKKQVWMQDQRNTGGKYFFLKCEENICMSNLKLNMYACICVCIKLNNRKLKKKGGKIFPQGYITIGTYIVKSILPYQIPLALANN